jgi:hypothetical protein
MNYLVFLYDLMLPECRGLLSVDSLIVFPDAVLLLLEPDSFAPYPYGGGTSDLILPSVRRNLLRLRTRSIRASVSY